MERVQLFATCLGDLLFPDAAADAELLLRDAGFEVDFPAAQVCCGQPAFNSGHRGAARRVARTFVKAFSREAPIVCPSGSCATMASPTTCRSCSASSRSTSWELSAFLDDRGSDRRRARTRAGGSPTTTPATCCASCGSRTAPRRLLERSGAELVPLPRPGSLLRVRRHVLGAATRGLARDGRRQAGRCRRPPTRSSPPTRAASCTCAGAPSTSVAASASSISRPRSRRGVDA